MAKNKGLGKGFADILFSDSDYLSEQSSDLANAVINVRISDIEPDKKQPRKVFNDESLSSLAQSIERHGVIQPLVVRKIPGDNSKYSLISGERRWRASKIAGITEVPVVVKDINDTEVAAIMLVENLQREDLNPVEQAQGLKRLIDEFGLTQAETAEIVGISRPALTNSLRLLSLPSEALDSLSSGDISAGHARALLSLMSEDDILTVLQTVVGKGLSVRETEKAVKIYINQKQNASNPPLIKDFKQVETKIYLDKLEEKISSALGRKTTISKINPKNKKGKLEIEYYNNEDLENLIKSLCGNNIFDDN